MANLSFFAGSAFQLRRPVSTSNGVTSPIDQLAKAQLDELAALLTKRIIPIGPPPIVAGKEPIAKEPGAHAKDAHAREKAHAVSSISPAVFVQHLLQQPLTPKFTPAVRGASWDSNSVAGALDSAPVVDGATLTEYIDTSAVLSALKYDFNNAYTENWNNLDFNTIAALNGYPVIIDYLVAYGSVIMGMTEVHGLANFIFSNSRGVNAIVAYATVGAARAYVQNEQMNVTGINDNGYPSNPSAVISNILSANIILSSTSFQPGISDIINDFVFNGDAYALIDSLKIDLTPTMRSRLVPFVKASPIPITASNAPFLIPGLITQNMAALTAAGPASPGDSNPDDGDYGVDYLEDDSTSIQVSQSALRCAAQLYYSMVLGDELNVFDAMDYFTHRYLVRQSIEISDAQLRSDLQLYVFSNKFTDLKSGRIEDRSRSAERAMFYRQVYNWGHGKITDDVLVNREFPKLWKVLMLESAAYIERAQISPNPASFVSKQKVMQSVEDLQYNLSTHCTGMANVITPMIYAELNFIIQRVFMHPEIIRQVVPQGGTWWRVVETLYVGMKNARPRSTVLYNKAKLGDQILRSIADYAPASFEQDGPFSDFISLVDAFITTQSILQRGLAEDLAQRDEEDDDAAKASDAAPKDRGAGAALNGSALNGAAPPASSPAPAAQSQDDWAF